MSGREKRRQPMENNGINGRAFIAPALAWAAGLMLVVIYAPRTKHINGMVGLGFLGLCLATVWSLYVLYKEYERTGKEWPFFLDDLFPNYPVVPDSDELSKRLSGFRGSLSRYLSKNWAEQNSDLQNYASQMMWHILPCFLPTRWEGIKSPVLPAGIPPPERTFWTAVITAAQNLPWRIWKTGWTVSG